MPIRVKRGPSGRTAYASALLGNYETLHVKVDPSTLNSVHVTDDGHLKPNVVFTLNGVAPTIATAVAQVETATVAGTISADGNINVTITSKYLDDGVKTYPVAVVNTDTATAVGGKIRTALGLIPEITQHYSVGGATTAVSLTDLNAGPNDATLNIALATGTATGLTAAPASANTTAGVAGSTSEVPCVTVESVKIADSNSSEDLNAANDCFVACAVNGTLNRDVMEDTLGRALTAAEIAILNGPNSKLVLSLT